MAKLNLWMNLGSLTLFFLRHRRRLLITTVTRPKHVCKFRGWKLMTAVGTCQSNEWHYRGTPAGAHANAVIRMVFYDLVWSSPSLSQWHRFEEQIRDNLVRRGKTFLWHIYWSHLELALRYRIGWFTPNVLAQNYIYNGGHASRNGLV